MKIIHISVGGPVQKISVNGTVYTFEWHPYCGPAKLNPNGDPSVTQPVAFLEAAGLWDEQGRRMEDGLCRWDYPAEPIRKHIGGRNYLVTGYHKPKRGS